LIVYAPLRLKTAVSLELGTTPPAQLLGVENAPPAGLIQLMSNANADRHAQTESAAAASTRRLVGRDMISLMTISYPGPNELSPERV
jgi:hypothetical protein